MLFFTSQKAITKVERELYTGSLSAMSTFGVAQTPTGYLRPLTEEQAAINGVQWGTAFNLIIETSTDIKQGDRITINSEVYLVRGVVNHDREGILAYKRCLIAKPQT